MKLQRPTLTLPLLPLYMRLPLKNGSSSHKCHYHPDPSLVIPDYLRKWREIPPNKTGGN